MTRKMYKFLCLALAVSSQMVSFAQGSDSKYGATPKDKWEVGLDLGHAFVAGDIDYKPGFLGGIHVRKSLDYVFAVRGDLMYGIMNGDNTARKPSAGGNLDKRTFAATAFSGDVNVVITLNNLRWDKPVHKISPYIFAGGGLVSNTVEFKDVDGIDVPFERKNNAAITGGAGIALRLSPKFNIALEHKVISAFGSAADFVDGYDNKPKNSNVTTGTTYRDVINYTTLKLNFNIGKSTGRSEPLWWINPMEAILTDVENLKARPALDLTDTDKDGVIDQIDQEDNSPSGAPVDTRGVALDSDGDGYADYKDKEPYSPPGIKVDGNGVAQVTKGLTQGDVDRSIDLAISKIKPVTPAPVASMSDWFLPIINFDYDKYGIKPSEASKLKQVAAAMQSNPSIRVVAYGYTDKVAGDSYNQVLSYNRANAAVEYLVAKHGISRDRLIINYGGENDNLVPANGPNYMNRRVEFRVAKGGETDNGRPAGPKAGKPGFSGSKNDGY